VIVEGLLNLHDAAARVGLKHLALRRAINRGELEAFKLCGRIRIDSAELDRWIESNSVARSDAAGVDERGP
jgi:excisionase family DNA binding protein